MKIKEIYERFFIPQNLQEHMLRVFGVVSFICDNWIGEAVAFNLLKKIALLHDLGNIVKFNLKDEEAGLKEIQQIIIKKYGADDHEATEKMLLELGMSPEAIQVINDKSFGNSISISQGNNYLLKILFYADMRVIPAGVESLENRILDVRQRMPKYFTRPDFEDLVNAAHQVEAQIQQNTKIPLSNITNETIALYLPEAFTVNIASE